MTNNDKKVFYLTVASIAFVSCLLWLILGERLVNLGADKINRVAVYSFFTGLMLAVAMAGVYAIIRAILIFIDYSSSTESVVLSLYRSILTEEDEGMFFKDKKGYYRFINHTAQKLLGLDGKVVVGKRDIQLFEPIFAHKIETEDKKILTSGETVIWEVSDDSDKGVEIWLCKKLLCRNKKGKVLGIAGYCRNITILKVFQQLNRDLESRYQTLFNKLPYAVLMLDAVSLKPFSFNQAMCNLLGYGNYEFSGMRFSAHMSEDDALAFTARLPELIERGGNDVSLRLLTRDKLDVHVNGYVQSLVIEGRQYLHMLLHDITELRRSTEELISSEVKYRSLFEYASDAILVVDINTLVILDANDVAVRILGYRRDELMRLTLLDMEAENEQAGTREQLNNLEIYNHVLYEHVLRNRKGLPVHVEINAHKVSYGTQEVYQFLIRDIGQRKQTEQALVSSERRYREMFEGNQAIKLVIDLENFIIEDANLAAANFYGYKQEQMRGMSLELINILARDKVLSLVQQAREQKLAYYTCPQRVSNGDIRIVEVRDGAMEINGRILLYSIVHDVTASKRAQDQLLLAAKMFDCSSDAVLITDRNYHIVSANQAFSDITGYQLSEVLNSEPDIILSGRNARLFSREVMTKIGEDGQWQGEIWHRLKNGETRPLQATINVVSDDQGNIINYIIMMSAMSGQNAGVCYGAEHYASLTGLPNKVIFVTQLRHAIERSQRAAKQLAVARIDLRDFSRINKTWSYEAGDQILRAIARRLKHNVRETDTVAHFAADDFAVLLDDLANVQQTGIVAQKILSTLGEEYQVDKSAIKLEVSIGIAIAPEDSVDAEELIEKAEYALRMAQQTPGNSFRLRSQHLNENAMQWLQIEMNLHEALKNDEFIMCYMPQISVQNATIESVEALARWKTAQGMVLPLKFLNHAEQSGSIDVIGFRLIEKAMQDYCRWREQGMVIKHLAVNIFASQITDELQTRLLELCTRYAIDPQCLMLDISEQVFCLSSGEQKAILRSLQSHGVKICLDDFGRGGASLACLLECHIDVIKVDRALVAASMHSADAAELVQGILALAGKMKICVVAEGVETAGEMDYLRRMGCVHMQGYYFCQPMNTDELTQYVTAQAMASQAN